MQLKKIALVFLVVVMMLSCVGVLTLAQGDATPSLDLSIKYSDSIKKGDKYVVKPGDSFDVSIWIDSNSGVKGLSVELNYNPEVLDVTAYYLGSIFSKNAEDSHINPPVIPAEGETPTGELSCWIEQNSTESDNTKTGVFVTYTFKVKDSFDGNIQDIAFGEIVAWNVGWDFLTINTIDKTETIYAHKFGNPELLPGDCVTAEKHVYTCERCGEKVVADLNTPGGHTYGNLIEEVPATCVTPGFKEHYKCSVCEKFFTKVGDEYIESSKEDLVIANGGHKFTINHTEIPAFCEKNGVEAHVECELCHQLGQEVADSDEYVEVTKADLDIPALEHILGSIVEYVAPSAAKFGFEAHYLCTRGCGQYFDSNGEKSTYNDLLIDKLPPEIKEADDFWVKGDANSKVEFKSDGHIDDFKDFWFNGSKLEKDKDYTVREGSIIVTLTDSFLETIDPGKTYEIGIESVSGTAKTTFEVGHDYGELVDRSEPTCMTNGNLPYYYCGAKCCNTYFDANKNIIAENVTDIPAQLVLKALGHKPAGAMIAAKAPTCTEIGYTIACYKCRVCDGYYNMSATGDFYDLSADVIEIPALGHNGVTKVDAKAPDCENAGNVEHFLCERCGKTVNADNEVIEVVLSALGHNGVTKVEAKAPTCEDDGNIEHFLCERCGKTVNADNEVIDAVIPAAGHKYGELIAQVDPTCEGTGTEAYYVCSVCGQLAQKAEGAEDYTKVTADDLVIPAAGHKYGELIAQVDPTCEDTGTEAYYVCSVCGQLAQKAEGAEDYTKVTADDLVIPAAGHKYGELIAQVDPTCEGTGTEAYYVCSVCGQLAQKAEGADDYTKVTADDLVIPAAGHKYGELIAQVDPTCEGTGTEAYYVCSVCGQLAQKAEGAEDYTKVTADDLVIPAAGHKYGELIAQVDPTCEGTGVIAYYKCSVCEKTFNSEKVEVTDLVIPAKGHEYGDLIAKVPATTEKDGAIAHYHCSACGKYFDAAKVEVSSIVIPKLPKIVSSPEEPWVKGSDDSLSFVSDAKFEDFVSVKLNGALLSESDYKLEKTEDGKTKITLEPATLEKLEAADYTITITSVNGSCDAGFTVENSSAVLAIVIVVIAVVVIGAGAAAAIVVLKKKNLL